MKSIGVIWPAVNQVAIKKLDIPEPGPGELLLEGMTLTSPCTERNWLLHWR